MVPQFIRDLAVDFAAKTGHSLYCVGGAVRDHVLGRKAKDWDLASAAHPDQTEAVLLELGWRTLSVGKSFGIIVGLLGEERVEIATFRADTTGGRHPEVRFTTLAEDVWRRDFTINALAYDIIQDKIVDYCNGHQDCINRRLRAVGDPFDRLQEDRLRVLRAIRFCARGFDPDRDLQDAIVNTKVAVSGERIRQEYLIGLQEGERFITALNRFGHFESVFPGCSPSPILNPATFSKVARKFPMAATAAILQGNPEVKVLVALERSKFGGNESDTVKFLHQLLQLPKQVGKLRRNLRTAVEEIEAFASLLDHKPAQHVKAFVKFCPSTTGQDLLKEGFSGPAIGQEMERRDGLEFFRIATS